MKVIIRCLLLTPLLFCGLALAGPNDDSMRTPGWYLNFGLGAAQTGYGSDIQNYANSMPGGIIDFGFDANSDNTSFGGKVAGGYIWNKNFATEFAYYNFSGASASGGSFLYSDNYTLDSRFSFDQEALAVSAVGRLPLGSSASDLYAKLGLAYTWVQFDAKYLIVGTPGPAWNPNQTTYDRTFSAGTLAPLAALGWEWNLGHHWAVSVEALGIFASSKSLGDPLNSKMSNAELYSVAGTYKF